MRVLSCYAVLPSGGLIAPEISYWSASTDNRSIRFGTALGDGVSRPGGMLGRTT